MKPLDALKNAVPIEQKMVYINPEILFTRLTAISQQQGEMEMYFEYEMSAFPLSLFKDGLMRKPDKPSLRKVLMPESFAVQKDQLPKDLVYVVDGGALLHRVRWMKGTTFGDIAKQYVTYVRKHYGDRTHIIFDGYGLPSTKSNEHSRRTMSKRCQDLDIVEANAAPCTQELLLSNEANKSKFINLIAAYLKQDGYHVFVCVADADTKIVLTALELAGNSEITNVAVVADDTDIAIMLIYHWNDELHDIFFYQQRQFKSWSIRETALQLGGRREQVLFAHAWTGCDTVSAPYGKGKPGFWDLLKNSEKLDDVYITMNDVWATREEIEDAAEVAFCKMYGGHDKESLLNLR